MKLIIESGATKTDFCLIDASVLSRFRLGGMNMATMPEKSLNEITGMAVAELAKVCVPEKIEEIFFYGAGVVPADTGGGNRPSVSVSATSPETLLKKNFGNACRVEFNSDLTASARALWGRRAGIAVILGTGSNSCLYDGNKVVDNVRPCGYVLGDFGSGAALGKAFLADFLQGQMPDSLSARFRDDYGLDYKSIVSSVYKELAPARYLASFAPYILGLADDGALESDCIRYLENLVMENFRTFIRRCLMRYLPSGFEAGVTGSFGCAAKEYLIKAGEEFGIRFTEFQPSPIEGLIKYHSQNV